MKKLLLWVLLLLSSLELVSCSNDSSTNEPTNILNYEHNIKVTSSGFIQVFKNNVQMNNNNNLQQIIEFGANTGDYIIAYAIDLAGQYHRVKIYKDNILIAESPISCNGYSNSCGVNCYVLP